MQHSLFGELNLFIYYGICKANITYLCFMKPLETDPWSFSSNSGIGDLWNLLLHTFAPDLNALKFDSQLVRQSVRSLYCCCHVCMLRLPISW